MLARPRFRRRFKQRETQDENEEQEKKKSKKDKMQIEPAATKQHQAGREQSIIR